MPYLFIDFAAARYFLWMSCITWRICLSLTNDILIFQPFVIEVVTNLCCEMQIQLDTNDNAECSWHWVAGVSNDRPLCSKMVFTTSDWSEFTRTRVTLNAFRTVVIVFLLLIIATRSYKKHLLFMIIDIFQIN